MATSLFVSYSASYWFMRLSAPFWPPANTPAEISKQPFAADHGDGGAGWQSSFTNPLRRAPASGEGQIQAGSARAGDHHVLRHPAQADGRKPPGSTACFSIPPTFYAGPASSPDHRLHAATRDRRPVDLPWLACPRPSCWQGRPGLLAHRRATVTGTSVDIICDPVKGQGKRVVADLLLVIPPWKGCRDRRRPPAPHRGLVSACFILRAARLRASFARSRTSAVPSIRPSCRSTRASTSASRWRRPRRVTDERRQPLRDGR